MAARRCERQVRQLAQSQMPNWETIQFDSIQPIHVDAKQLFEEELGRFDSLLEESDLEGIIARYPVRHSDAFAKIETALEMSRQHYRRALISMVKRESEFAQILRNRLEPLAAVLSNSN